MGWTDELAAALAGPEGVQAALEWTLGHLGADSGTVHRSDGDVLELAAHGPLPPDVLEVIRRIPVGRGMAGLAVELGRPVTWCNLQEDDSGAVRSGAKDTGLKGSIVVPILAGDRPVGSLGVANQGERTFRPEEEELLLEVGRHIAAHWGVD